MRHSHVQLIDLLVDSLRFAGVPERSVAPLLSLKQDAQDRSPEWFNVLRARVEPAIS
jgi:hypothetical protein